jgi:hypothetical protein
MSLTSPPSSLLITYPYHLCLASLTFSAMSSTLRLRISSTPSCFWPALLYLLLQVHMISVLLHSPFLQCLPQVSFIFSY